MIYLNQFTLRSYQTYKTQGSSRIIDSVMDHVINLSKNDPLAGSSYIKLPK